MNKHLQELVKELGKHGLGLGLVSPSLYQKQEQRCQREQGDNYFLEKIHLPP